MDPSEFSFLCLCLMEPTKISSVSNKMGIVVDLMTFTTSDMAVTNFRVCALTN